MGVHVNLSLLSESIGRDQWNQIFGETVRLLAGWPDPPLGIAKRLVEGVPVVVFSGSYETDEGWKIVGDQRSRLTGESFEFPRELQSEPVTGGGISRAPNDCDDILVALVRDLHDRGAHYSRLYPVFRDKTVGRPYHGLLVAVATLVENRFPKHALAHGDLSASQADRACKVLERIFGEKFAPPVLVDEQRIRSRVPKEVADEVMSVYAPPPHSAFIADLLGIAMQDLTTKLRHDLEWNAPGCTDARKLDEVTHLFLDTLTARVVQLTARWEKGRPVLSKQQRTQRLREIAVGTDHHGVHLTEIAWNEIEQSDDVTLAFLRGLVGLKLREKHLHLAATAMFESRALRERATARWADGCPVPDSTHVLYGSPGTQRLER